MRTTQQRPAMLDYSSGYIYAQCSDAMQRALLACRGAGRCTSTPNTVYLPASRQAFLAAESLSVISWVGDDYRLARAESMRLACGQEVWALARQLVDKRLNESLKLLPQQEEFINFAYCKRGALNASEQGTGKTVPAWLLIQLWNVKRALVVTNASLVTQWRDEADLIWSAPPHEYVALVKAPVKDRAAKLAMLSSHYRSDCMVVCGVNYEALNQLAPAITQHLRPECVIFDESYRLGNRKSAMWKAAKRITESPSVQHVLCLTGTPVGQHPATLWSQLALLGEDAMPFDYDQFLTRYCKVERRMFGGWPKMVPVGAADPVGLMELIEPHYYRATVSVGAVLPPFRDELVKLKMGEAQQRLYEAVDRDGEVALGNSLALGGEAQTRLRLHQVAGGFRPVPLGEGRTTYDCQPLGYCPKWEWLLHYTKDNLIGDPTRRLLVWCAYNHEVDYLTGLFNEWLGGGRAVGARAGMKEDLDEVKRSFNSRAADGVQVIVAQLEKLAAGHNLQHGCAAAVYYSLNWRRVTHSQSRKRIHRHGQLQPVIYYYLLSTNTIDEEVYDRHLRMEDMAERLMPDTNGVVGVDT